ncbi:MAG TPA: hypothetical protein VGC05_13065 [Mycobacterium sp.]
MESDRFRPLLEAHGPFASVYFDDSQDTDDATTELDLNSRALRKQLKGQGADESTISAIDDAVIDVRLPVGRGRRAMIAGSTAIVLNEYLLQPVGNMLSEHGAVPTRTLQADEALPLPATSCGAAMVRTDERIAPVDSIGAVLSSPVPAPRQPACHAAAAAAARCYTAAAATTLETGLGGGGGI